MMKQPAERPTLRVLVVDDDRLTSMVHARLLEQAGYDVTTASDGEQALALLATLGIDLVVLDSNMPGMSGVEVVTALRSRGASLPVMMVTGASRIDDVVEGLEAGADDYIIKPVASRELIARVQALIRGRDAAIASATDARDPDGVGHREVCELIRTNDFMPVFQPIVTLPERRVVAYEALTRFGNGRRPDLQFLHADRVGLGDELALATLAASIDHAVDLPADAALHLNVAPGLLKHPLLSSLLNTASRPIVVELTEHDPIDDYDVVSSQLNSLGPAVRFAIDDAGAGYSSMAHVLALRPDEVKLDRQWVSGVDTDLPRQALIGGLVSFAAATDTILVAEGVESEAEAHMLIELGVSHAQGFHFGRPRPALDWARTTTLCAV